MTFSSCQKSSKVIEEKWGNGTPKISLNFNNIKDSTYTRTEYFENGKIESNQEFVNGKLNGKLVNYSEKGRKVQEFNYLNGKKTVSELRGMKMVKLHSNLNLRMILFMMGPNILKTVSREF